jgi:hypothetical protein
MSETTKILECIFALTALAAPILFMGWLAREVVRDWTLGYPRHCGDPDEIRTTRQALSFGQWREDR